MSLVANAFMDENDPSDPAFGLCMWVNNWKYSSHQWKENKYWLDTTKQYIVVLAGSSNRIEKDQSYVLYPMIY